ncbi:MAG: chemotaxis protein CheC [Clostridiales Family XIII bacterium]|nr:chemotaxis protein CheC [Clostridiales Family XIII bacterium]
MIHTYGDLSDMHLDILSEIGNIGAGNAATSLAILLGERVDITVPSVRLLEYKDVISSTLGDPEELGVAILINYTGDIRGVVLFLLGYEDARGITDILTDGMEDNTDNYGGSGLSEMKLSAIKEIGNILGSSYLGSLSTLTNLHVNISVPYMAIDMVGAIMGPPMLEFSIDNKNIMLIEESFMTSRGSLKSHVILFADIPSLNRIMKELGLFI